MGNARKEAKMREGNGRGLCGGMEGGCVMEGMVVDREGAKGEWGGKWQEEIRGRDG